MPEWAPKREAVLTAYWSPRIQSLMAEWDATMEEVQRSGVQVAFGDKYKKAHGKEWPVSQGAHSRLLVAYEGLSPIDKRIREQVRRELLGQDDGRE